MPGPDRGLVVTGVLEHDPPVCRGGGPAGFVQGLRQRLEEDAVGSAELDDPCRAPAVVLEMSDDVQAGRRGLDREEAPQLPLDRVDHGSLALRQHRPDPTLVAGEVAAGDEPGQGALLEDRRAAIEHLEGGREALDEPLRQDDTAGPQSRVEDPAERGEVDDPPVAVEALDGGQRLAPVADVALAVVLDDEGADLGGPAQEAGPAGEWQRAAGRVLPGRGHDDEARLRAAGRR